MACIWKHPKRPTKETNRAKAHGMAQKFEGAYRTKLTEAQARKVVSDIYQEIHGEQLFHASVRRFFTDWIANRKAELQPGAHKRYENAVDKLLRFLADRADRDIAYVHKRDITALRDTTATNLSASTANTDLKILRSAFKQAVSDGLRLDNPATAVSELTDRKALNDPERRQLPRNVRRASSKACLHARSSDSVRTFMTHASARVAACGKTRLPQQ